MLRRGAWLLGNRLMAVRGLAVSSEAEIKASEEMFAPTKFKPPTKVFGVSGRYASACWSAAADQEKLETVEKELDDIKKLLHENPEFLERLADPTELRHRKIKDVGELFTKAGVDTLLKNLFVVMAENGRMGLIPKVVADYKKLMNAHRKETIVKVTTAEDLNTSEQKQLLLSLKKRIGEDKNISLDVHVEPEIVGGIIVEWDDAYRMDLSVATSIKRLEAELMNAV